MTGVRHCYDCNTEFDFTADEAEFFVAHGFKPPNRCKLCRAWRRYTDAGMTPSRILCSECGDVDVVPFTTAETTRCKACHRKQGAPR